MGIFYVQMFPCFPILTKGGLCLPTLGTGERYQQSVHVKFNFFSLGRRGQEKMVMSVVLLLWIRVFWIRGTREPHAEVAVQGFPYWAEFLSHDSGTTPALTDGMAPARSLLWQRPRISCHIVWNELKWLWVCLLLCTRSSQQILLRREICPVWSWHSI